MASATPTSAAASDAGDIYRGKPASYFGNARHDIVAMMSPNGAVLELGCGSGGTGRAALASGKAQRYVGIELSETAARVARQDLSEVLVGDVESLDLSGLAGEFDTLVVSEVLEHLRDPWTTMVKLVACLKPGGQVFASSPNIAHWAVIRELFLGRFRYDEVGVMDRTHLRWFTPESYRQLFEDAGVAVDRIVPLVEPGWKARLIGRLSGGRLSHLFTVQIMLSGHRR